MTFVIKLIKCEFNRNPTVDSEPLLQSVFSLTRNVYQQLSTYCSYCLLGLIVIMLDSTALNCLTSVDNAFLSLPAVRHVTCRHVQVTVFHKNIGHVPVSDYWWSSGVTFQRVMTAVIRRHVPVSDCLVGGPHLSCDDCPEVRNENNHNYYVLCCVRQLCTVNTVICIHMWTVLKFACWFRFRFRFCVFKLSAFGISLDRFIPVLGLISSVQVKSLAAW